MSRNLPNPALLLAALLPIAWAGASPAKAEKLKPEQLIQRHLESIGPEMDAKKPRTIRHTGSVVLDLLTGGSGHLEGDAEIFADGGRTCFVLDMGNANYGRERFVFDGEEADVGYISPGNRSPVGEFLFTYKELLSEGLFGGVLTSAWSPLETGEREPRLKVRGLKKVDGGGKAWELDYRRRKGGSDVTVRLYFDEETFRHVKTTYDVSIPAAMGRTPQESARQFPTRVSVTEEFSQFRPVEDLTLPARWEITYHLEQTGRGQVWKWTVDLTETVLNGPVAAENFERY